MVHTVAVIGLGKIGMLYDEQLPPETYVLSHARAFDVHPAFSLVVAVDPSVELRDKFIHGFRAPAYVGVAELVAKHRPDVFVVATPTGLHGAVVADILASQRPLAILCEKPLAYDRETVDAMVSACASAEVPLFVNFIRRADPGVIEVRERLLSGQIAAPFKAVVWYSKGLLHNGSHFADLLTFWFGPIRNARLISAGPSLSGHDAEPDGLFEFDGGQAVMLAAREENFSHYTVEVVAANGRLHYGQGGVIRWQGVVQDARLSQYKYLESEGSSIANDMNRYQYRVADQLSRALAGEPHTLCTGASSATTQRWLEQLINERT